MPLFRHDITTLNLPAERRSGMMDDPTTPLTAIAVWNELDGGPTAAGELVSERTAMSISTVYTCVTTLSEAVASLPCKLMRHVDKGGQKAAVDNHIYYLLAVEPNPEMTAFTFWSTMVGCSALTGNGYAEIRRDPDGSVSGLWPLHPLKTEPVRMPDGTLAFRTSDGEKEGSFRYIKSADILHFPLFALDGIRGVGPVGAAREAFALAKAAEKFGARWFGNGAHVPSILINKGPKPDPKVQREMKESWQQAYGGNNSGKQAFLWGDWDVKTVGLSPEDSQFLATRKFQLCEIAAMFHLQPHQVGDTSRLSNANHVQAQLTFVSDTLRPICARIEAELQRKLLSKSKDLFVEFDLSERTRGDFAALTAAYAMYLDRAVMCPNEVRQAIGMNPYGPEGDVFTYALNKGNAEQLLKDPSLIPTTQEPAPEPNDPTTDPLNDQGSQNPAPKKKGKK